jgi:hypothetical protein
LDFVSIKVLVRFSADRDRAIVDMSAALGDEKFCIPLQLKAYQVSQNIITFDFTKFPDTDKNRHQ